LWRLTAHKISEIFGVRVTKKLKGKLNTTLEQIERGHHIEFIKTLANPYGKHPKHASKRRLYVYSLTGTRKWKSWEKTSLVIAVRLLYSKSLQICGPKDAIVKRARVFSVASGGHGPVTIDFVGRGRDFSPRQQNICNNGERRTIMAEAKEETREILAKLQKKTAISDEELKQLQQHVDILERAAAGSHHHHDDSKLQ
jgi:hypothetical protein